MNQPLDPIAIEAAWRAAAAACVKDGHYTAPVSAEDWEAALRPAIAAALALVCSKPVAYGRLREGRLVGLGYDRDDDANMTVPLCIIGSSDAPAGLPPVDRSEELELIMDVCRTTVLAGSDVPVHQVRRLHEFYANAGATAQAEELQGIFAAAADPDRHTGLPTLVRGDVREEAPSGHVAGQMASALRNVAENGSSTAPGKCGGCYYTCCGVFAESPDVKHEKDCFVLEAKAALTAYDTQLAELA